MPRIILDEMPKNKKECPFYKDYPNYQCTINLRECSIDPCNCDKIRVLNIESDDMK